MFLTITTITLAACVLMLSTTATTTSVAEPRLKGLVSRLGLWSSVSYAAMLLGLLGTTLTGVTAFIFWGGPMSGWLLMAHCSAGPLFALGVTGIALTWAERCTFGQASYAFGPVQKALYWLILMCGAVVIVTAVSPMMPWAGTHGQHLLYLTHRYSSLVLLALTVLHALGFARSK